MLHTNMEFVRNFYDLSFFYKLKQDSSIWYCITGISLDTTECIIVLLVTCYRNVI